MTEQQDSTVLQTPKPTPVQVASVKVQSVLKIAFIRTAAGLELALPMQGRTLSLEHVSRVKVPKACLQTQDLVQDGISGL